MHEPARPQLIDVKVLWREQPPEAGTVPPVGLALQGRRLHLLTRSEILAAVTAILFFTIVLWWTVGANGVTMTCLAVTIVWVVTTLLWLRRHVWPLTSDAFATSGVEFYRGELQQRLRHLRNAWLWHGPLLLGCMRLAGVATGMGNLAYRRFAQVIPLAIALLIWTVFNIRQRRRQADAIRRELDEIAAASPRIRT